MKENLFELFIKSYADNNVNRGKLYTEDDMEAAFNGGAEVAKKLIIDSIEGHIKECKAFEDEDTKTSKDYLLALSNTLATLKQDRKINNEKRRRNREKGHRKVR